MKKNTKKFLIFTLLFFFAFFTIKTIYDLKKNIQNLENYAKNSAILDNTNYFQQVLFNGKNKDLPDTLNIYRVSFTKDLDLKDKLIKKYDLKQKNINGNIIYLQKNISLIYSKNQNSYEFSINKSIDMPINKTDEQKILNIAEQFKQTFDIKDFYVIPEVEFSNWGVEHQQETSSFNLAKVYLTLKLDDYPIIINRSNTYPIELWINGAFEIQKIVFPEKLPEFKKITELKVIPKNTAISNIKKGFGVIIKTYNTNLIHADIEKIKMCVLADYNIEYRIDTGTLQAIPYYSFVGNAENFKNEIYKVKLITPAVFLQ